ncbi:succinylglutamate desuccinylase/aspartoacylase family protein [Runella zeae]|uniref:succinylglutamate desuccinylase/aspartoacylase family protein n=1 Tax=Runella zeae TaxID=94255 RepID=UPI000687B264|nr:M14 family metallopeptidase [Runella zeae]
MNLVRSYTLKSDQSGPHVLLIAGVHGDEYEPMKAVLVLKEIVSKLLCKGSVTIVPTANESAFRNGSRCGEDGLDLARTCPGAPDGSITERISDEVSQLIRQADYLVDMHTGGVMFDIAALAGYMLHADSFVLERQRTMAKACQLPIVWGTEPTPEGRTLSIARDAGVPAIYLEYGGGTNFRPQVVEAYQIAFLNILSWLEMIENKPEETLQEPAFWVEDHRVLSGYLQAMLPAPTDGFFVGEKVIGEFVKKGERWGYVLDPISGLETEVFCDKDGLAFLKRALIKVQKGDALGGILPITQTGKIVIYES